MTMDVRQTPTGAPARAILADGRRLLEQLTWFNATLNRAVADVIDAHRKLTRPLALERLASIGVERLRESSSGRLRLAGLAEHGFATVADIVRAPESALTIVPGIGPQSATAIRAAALAIADAISNTLTVSIVHDPENRTTTPLVVAVGCLASLHRSEQPIRPLLKATEPLARALHDARAAGSKVQWFFQSRAAKEVASRALATITAYLDQAESFLVNARISEAQVAPEPAACWAWFADNPAGFYALLEKTVGLQLDTVAVEGYLPGEIVDRIRAFTLREDACRVSLRGYQSFGARFALIQRRVILGDEMGLGKTVQALAAAAHLWAEGGRHILVVCPASVLINWMREIVAHTTLPALRLHGPDRDATLARWLAEGGIGVTTFETLSALDLPDDLRLSALIVDEAHYVKNPEAKRSKRVYAVGRRADYAWYLTGTPMENRLDEFQSLLGMLAPPTIVDVEGADGVAGVQAFRMAVAPVYLRRNAEDVLTELPPLEQLDEWLNFVGEDGRTYRDAVAVSNFSMMRRAAFCTSDRTESAKIDRLLDLVAQARANGRKVIIFSFFLGVLTTVMDALRRSEVCPDALGPLTGSTPAGERQHLVDALGEDGPGVLVAQIQAGGTGLNIQAASVVILCEPQLKPSLETQAIARARRMGQLSTVHVHRLLIDESVDERLLELLGHKQRLFDAYAKESALADASPLAVDVSEVSLMRQLVAAEQQRLHDVDG